MPQYSQDLPGKTQEGFQTVNTISLGGLLENMDSGVALLEMGETIRLIYVSPSFCRVLGVEAEHFPLPRSLAQIIHPDDWPHLEQTLRQGAAQGGHIQHTHRISPDGKAWFWWQIRASRIEYNNPYPVMLVTTTDVSPFKENETQLLESNERLRSAFEQTTQGMWEVDLQSRIFTLYHYSKSPQVTAPPQGKFPDFLIENGWIHPSSVKLFREFARELLEGRIQGYGNFIIQFQDTGCYSWASLSYRRLEDDAGAVRAVGIIEKPPQTMQGPRETILTEHALPDAMTPYLVGVLHGNLSRNSVEKYWMEGRHAGRGTISCAQALEQGRKKMFSEDDRRSLNAYFDVAQLLALFARGERICSMDYRRVDGSGSIGWVNCLMNLAQDSLTRDIHLYLWLLRADARHRYEQELETPPVRDAETGLYDRATTRALVEARMDQGMAVPCAFALIQLEGLDRLEQTSPRQGSHPAAVLGAVLGPRALVGQYTRQELLVFFPEANQDEAKQMLEGAFAFVRTSLADVKGMDSLRFVAGVVAGDAAQAHEAAVIAQCHQLCQGWQNASSDIVAFSQEAGDWSQLRQSCPEDQVTVQAALPERPLTEEEKDTALKCVSAMLSAGSSHASALPEGAGGRVLNPKHGFHDCRRGGGAMAFGCASPEKRSTDGRVPLHRESPGTPGGCSPGSHAGSPHCGGGKALSPPGPGTGRQWRGSFAEPAQPAFLYQCRMHPYLGCIQLHGRGVPGYSRSAVHQWQPGLCVRQGGFAICFQGAGGPFREHPSFSHLGR